MAKLRFKKNVRKEAKKAAKILAEEYEIEDAGGIVYLSAFADSFSAELNCQDIIEADGLTVKDKWGQLKSHPLCSVLRDARAQKLAALKALNLDIEPLRDRRGRPGGK